MLYYQKERKEDVMLIIIIVLIAVIVLWLIASYNGFIKLKNRLEEAFSTMDVYLKKRYDLIPNLVETVKGYAKHESETLEKVIQARNFAMNATSIDDKISNEKSLQSTLSHLFALSESYPDLKANTNFITMQNDLKSMEGEIANARKYYNAIVREFNTKCESFPSNIIASIFKFKKQPLFEIEESHRDNIKISF